MVDDLLDKGRERLGLVPFAPGKVFDQAGVEINGDFVPRPNPVRGLGALEDGKPDIDRVAVENPREGLGDDAGNP